MSSMTAFQFASLGSGSKGNALLVQAGAPDARTTILLDCGFAMRETKARLARLALAPDQIDAILVTHEHKDHIGGALPLARRYKIPLWMTHGTRRAIGGDADGLPIHICRDGEAFMLGALHITPYAVPHDAHEPVQFVIQSGDARLGVLTDAGKLTAHVVQALHRCHALVLECNHDRHMLASSDYPFSLKRRIGGEYGHLSNETAAAILSALDQSVLKMVVGAHLSEQNNIPERARAALVGAVDTAKTDIRIATQEYGFDWLQVMASVLNAGTFTELSGQMSDS